MKSLARVGGILLLVATVGGIALSGVFHAMNPLRPGAEPTYVGMMWLSSFVGFPLVGALIIWKLPRHNMGWILCGIGATISLASFLGEYATYALITRAGDVPGGSTAAWIASWLSVITAALILLLLIYFPRGEPRNGFWRRITAFVVIAAAALCVMYALRPGPLDAAPTVDNPLGVPGLRTFVDIPIALLANLLGLVLVASVVDKFILFRRAGGVERQQIKWFALAALSFPIMFGISIILEGAFGRNRFGDIDPVVIAFMLGFNGMATAIGLAVFKYRLYDVGALVNRTLVYGALTAILAGAYVGLVFGFQAVLEPITAESDLAIAASTLAVAALFRPVRTRVQSFIDRRFYRRKFDVQRTLEEFGEHVRDEVELESLSARLEQVVHDTMQPAHVSVWIRTAEGR